MMNYPKNFKNYLPFLLWTFFCIAMVLFFIGPINNLLDKLLVKPLISEFKSTLINELVFFLLSGGISTWLIIYAGNRFLRTLAVLIIYFYTLELSQVYWQFLHLIGVPILRYWDLVVIALVIPACFTYKHRTIPTPHNPSPNSFIEDLPIESHEQDAFNRKEVAKEIAGRISVTDNKKSFAIGILGEYGSGKTSFINLIKSYLNKADTEVIDFNPWSAEGPPNIQRDFFDLLASRLHELNPKVSGLMLDYSRKLSHLDTGFEKTIRKIGFVSSLFTPSSYADDYVKINELLKTSQKKIIVTIDDLDRLYKDEVIEVLRLIRNTASFTNIIYLVAYERSYIQDSIKLVNANAGNSYLDKIIQLEIPLPKRENNDLLHLLENLLSGFVAETDIDSYRTHILETGFKNQFNFAFEKIFRHSRDVVKFINNFKIAYKLLGKEVMFESLFVLELLKFRFPLIYDRLFENRYDFIRHIPSRSSHNEYYELKTYKEEKEDNLVIGRTLREEKNYEEKEIVLISGLLNNLFFKFSRSTKAKNAIIYPMFFERYFRYRLGALEMSEREFKAAWETGLSGMIDYVKYCFDKGMLSDLRTRLFQQKAKNRADFELQIESLFQVGAMYPKKDDRIVFDTDALISLLWNYEHNIDKKYYKGDENAYRKFLEGLFENVGDRYTFAAKFIADIKHDKRDISIPVHQLIEFEIRYFQQFLNEHGLTKDAVFMFWRIRHEFNEPVPGKPGMITERSEFEPKIIPIMKEALTTYDPYQFLKYTIKYDMRERELVFIHSEILAMYEKPAELRDFVAKNNIITPEIKADYLAFFDAVKSKAFKNWANYEFTTTLKPKPNDDD